jgi:hypothetical protein
MLASLAMEVGNVIISAFSTLGAVFLWPLAYRHRVLEVARWGAWSWPVLFLGEDLATLKIHDRHWFVLYIDGGPFWRWR